MFVNRWGILVRAKQPYVDWANSFEDGGPTMTLGERRSAPTMYLVHEHEDTDLRELIAGWYWEAIFDLELVSWMRETSTWPQNRTTEMFYEWFDVELASELVDLAKGHIKSG